MKLVVAHFISPISILASLSQCRIPLNPVLGETLQAEMPTGERMFCEQVSHHPPISAFMLEGANGDYTCYGHASYGSTFSGINSLALVRNGKTTLKFKDGTTYEFEAPKCILQGLLKGTTTQVFYSSEIITDVTNNIKCEIKFNPSYDDSVSGALSRSMSWFGGATQS